LISSASAAAASASSSSFKAHYSKDWEKTGNPREAIAGWWLSLALKDYIGPEDLLLVGNGTLSPELNDFYDGTPDFAVPKLRLIFEVTGSNKTMEYSMARCMEHEGTIDPYLFIREGKVFAASLAGIVSRLVFVSINDMEDIVFLPCSKIINNGRKAPYRTVPWYEHVPGMECQPYYMIPWKDWWKPKQLTEFVRKRMEASQ